MTITAAVCTFNGESRIARTLDSLLAQTLDPGQREILVIDNASTDRTAAIVGQYGEQCKYVFEPEPGLSAARNRALHEAKGDVIAFIDDDAVADHTWLERLQSAFRDPTVIGAGGRIDLVWPTSAPRWFGTDLAGLFSGLDLGGDSIELDSENYPFGTNMAVRRDLALQLGGFRTDLGRVGTSLISFEEIEFFERLSAVAGKVVYLPEASVDHHIDSSRVSLRWLLRRARHNGMSQALMTSGENGPTAPTMTEVLMPLLRGCAYVGRALLRLLRYGPNTPPVVLDLSRASHWGGVVAGRVSALRRSGTATAGSSSR